MPEVKRVLVIDDHPVVLSALAERLARLDLEVLQARSGREGLETARLHKPDLIICDLFMPGLDGFSVLTTVKADAELDHVPFVIWSAETSLHNIRRCLQAGAFAYVSKGVDLAGIVRAVERDVAVQ